MESVAATALGFAQYADRIGVDIEVAGILAQRAHGGRHADGIRDALPEDLTSSVEFRRCQTGGPDRRLGLHMGSEAGLDRDALSTAARPSISSGWSNGRAPPEVATTERNTATRRLTAGSPSPGQAFCFVYPSTGATRSRRPSTFSPVAGDDSRTATASTSPAAIPSSTASRSSPAGHSMRLPFVPPTVSPSTASAAG